MTDRLTEPRMYVLMRCDLPQMSWPKAMGQVGHAISMALYATMTLHHPNKAIDYMKHSGQSKVILRAKSLADLEKAKAKADELGIANALVVDEGRTEFDGPTPTCLGLGPTTAFEAAPIVKRLQVLQEKDFQR